MYLSKQNKQTVSDLAAKNWRMAKTAYTLSPIESHKFAVQWTARDIRKDRRLKSKFGSIITSIIISLAIRFATQLLLKWLKEEFGEQSER